MELELLESNAVRQSPSRIEELVKIFVHATKVFPPSIRVAIVKLTVTFADGDWILGDGIWPVKRAQQWLTEVQ